MVTLNWRSGGAYMVKLSREQFWQMRMLLVGSTMPDRSSVMTQNKRDNLALQVGGYA
jgi:hypothetical protein